jgi:hypothetical protein
VLDRAERDVQRHAVGSEVLHRIGQRVLDRRITGVEVAWRGQRVRRVEGDAPPLGRVVEPAVGLLPQDLAAAGHVGAAVPGVKYRARGAHVDLAAVGGRQHRMGAAHRHHRGAGEVRAVVALAEHGVLEAAQGEAGRTVAVGARQPRSDHVEAEPGPQLELDAGVIDGRQAGERR